MNNRSIFALVLLIAFIVLLIMNIIEIRNSVNKGTLLGVVSNGLGIIAMVLVLTVNRKK